MATYSLQSLLNTTDNMDEIVSEVSKYATLEIAGVDWFIYSGNIADKIYITTTHSVRFGTQENQLNVLKHSYGQIEKVYRQEGVLDEGIKFLKIRVEGHTSVYSTDSRYPAYYELFLFDDGNIMLYMLKSPTDISSSTTRNVTDRKKTLDLSGYITASIKDSSPKPILISNAYIDLTVAEKMYTPIIEAGIRVKSNATAENFSGNQPDLTGLIIESYDNAGNTNTVSSFILPEFDISTIGTQEYTISYKTYTTQFPIVYIEDTVLEITSISIQNHYVVGQSISNIKIYVKRKSEKREWISSGFDVTGFDSSTTGTKEIAITCGEAAYTYNVYISATSELSVSETARTQYYIGDEFEKPGCSIVYDDGYKQAVSGAVFSGYDNTSAGEQIITVTVGELSTTYTINVSGTYSADISSTTEATVTAELDLITGILTISGTGNTKEISSPSWGTGGIFDDGGSGQSEKIRKVIVAEGITGLIGACFYGLSGITEVTLPNSLLRIGKECFENCSGISQLELPESVNYIGTSAFYGCPDLVLTVLGKNVSIEDSYYTMRVKTIRGRINSTAESYAEKYSIPFEIIDKVSKIEITSYPSRGYHIGESVDKSDLTVKITLEDGTEQETDSYELGYDFSTTGIKTVTVSLGGQTASFTVNVTAYKLSELINTTDGMEVIRNNSKNDDNTDAVDGVSWFKFNNVTANKLYINGNNWIGFGTSAQQLKICNRDGAVWHIYRLETTLDNGVKLFKIRVEGYTYYSASGTHESQIEYELFLFDNGDMYLNVIKSPVSSSSYAGTSSLISSSKTTNLSLNGATEENPVQVSFLHQDESGLDWEIAYRAYKFSTLSGILVKTLPDRTKYKVNETFDPSGLIVTAVYDSGETETITDYTLSPPDMTSYGTKSVTVTYETFTTAFEITVIDATGIEVTTLPDKTRYYENEAFSPAGLVVSQVYTDGSKETISGYGISTPDMTAGGNKIITVTYNDFTTTFEITVIGISGIEITKVPTKKEYYTGDSLDVAGMAVILKYTDGTSKALTEYTVSGFDSTNAGEKTITVTYKTHTASFKVTVYAASGIRIASLPNRVYYKIGEAIDLTGLVVMLIRNDGTEEEIHDYEVNGFDSSKTGSKTITVFYNKDVSGITTYVGSDTFQIKVTNDGTNPFEEEAGDIFVTVHWINGEFEDLTSENNTIQSSSLVLQESICSESYFIFGGCVSNQITFKAHHTQFDSVEEEFYPSGKIEVYLKCKDTEVKIFTGEIASAERDNNSWVRTFIAYDYLYNLQNTDIAWWYKNQTTDKNKLLTQRQFRDALFKYIGIEQVETKLHWDDTYVPNTQNSNEMKVTNILKDLCLQNDRFGHINRDGKFEYLKLRQNTYKYGESTSGKKLYKYYNNAEIHLDTFKSFWAKEGRIWFPNVIHTDPDPNRAYGFTEGEMTAQEAYENNVFYNRNSFFVGNEDWLNYAWDADEYKQISREKPIVKICYGTFVNLDLRKFYRAQGYKVEVVGNPLNTVGQPIELRTTKQLEDGTELEWFVHSYIMSRTLKLGNSKLIDTYSANNAPFNGNTRQLGNNTPEISATVNRTRAEMPVISYEFSDGSSDFSPQSTENTGSGRKLTSLRCLKQIKYDDYEALPEADKKSGTIFFTYKDTK